MRNIAQTSITQPLPELAESVDQIDVDGTLCNEVIGSDLDNLLDILLEEPDAYNEYFSRSSSIAQYILIVEFSLQIYVIFPIFTEIILKIHPIHPFLSVI